MRVTDVHDQNQNVAAYEAEIEAIVTPYRAKIEPGIRLKAIVLISGFFSSEIQ